jgi:uncharacterized protein YegL
MKDEYLLRQEELVDNPTARVPICLVLDVSGSMSGAPIDELQDGVSLFFEAIRSDDIAQYSAEIAIVTFGGVVTRKLDFFSIQRQEVPDLYADGGTPMGEAVSTALDMLEARKMEYQNAGIDYYQPWMVLMTDGMPTDNIQEALRRTQDLTISKKLVVFPIAIGDGADVAELSKFAPGRGALKLKGLNFKEFFVWLSQSVSRVSQSAPGEEIKLDTSTIDKWATI